MTQASTAPFKSNFVTTEWLAEHLDDPDLVVVDGSWHLPTAKRDPKAEYLTGHIPGAVYFDIDTIADPSSGLPHMLPIQDAFAAAMRTLGIGEDMQIIVYDGAGLFSAPRVWWTLKTFGAKRVMVLDGGLPRWKAEGRPLETGPVDRAPRTFNARLDAEAVADTTSVQSASHAGDTQIVDARSVARFLGEEPEPRPGVQPGHIPGSVNVHYAALVHDGTMKPPAEVVAAFKAAGVDLDRPIITTCGSGVTAAILTLALAEAGKRDVRLYDGSWTEWGARTDLPKATSR